MPLGVISDELFLQMLTDGSVLSPFVSLPTQSPSIKPPIIPFSGSPENSVVECVIPPNKLGRPEGRKEIPSEIRKFIATSAIEGGETNKEIARIFKVSKDSVNAYKHGATSEATYNKPDGDLAPHVRSVRQRLVGKAQRVLKSSLNQITDEALSEIGPVRAAGIAKDMSSIIKNLEPQIQDDDDKVTYNTVFYAPQLAKESDFEYVDVDDVGQVQFPVNSVSKMPE